MPILNYVDRKLQDPQFCVDDASEKLGTFPKEFSLAATSNGYFTMWQHPKCAISITATVLAAALGFSILFMPQRLPPHQILEGLN